MGERTEYWWVLYETEIRPAEVGFVGGIPARIWMIGAEGSLPATAVELLERLPIPPKPVLTAPAEHTQPRKPERSLSALWLAGIVLLIIIAQFSGRIFDAIK